MGSKYDELDASTELEQALALDLRAALASRGCEVVHHGTNNGGRHSPGGKPDIEVRDHPNRRLILVEVTRRKSSAAEGEFIAITDHLDKAIAAGGYDDYGVLYVSPYTSARLSASFRDLGNRSRARDGRPGRIVAIDFAAAEMLTSKLAETPSDEYPSARFGDLFRRWEEAVDDSLARLLIQQTFFPEDEALAIDLELEVDEFAADRERRLKNQLEKIENDLRDRGVVGEGANQVVIYLTFIRLYEERRQRREGKPNRFTVAGFEEWCSEAHATVKRLYEGRMVEGLLHEIAQDPDLEAAGLLRDPTGRPQRLHAKITDQFVISRVLPVFDEYDFHTGRVDMLGAVFETLARRAEKDTKVGQFFTPQPVVDFCAEMVPLRPQDRVLDPAVGTARFLIQAMNRMLERAANGVEPQEQAVAAIKAKRLLGTDIGSWVATIAKMNMFIHDDGKTNIQEANGLVLGDRPVFVGFPNGLSGEIDVVLTNPPLGDTSHEVAVEHWRALGGDDDTNGLLDRLGVVPMRTLEQDRLLDAEAKLLAVDAEIEQLEALLPDPIATRQLKNARRKRDTRFEKVAQLRMAITSGNLTRVPANSRMKGGALFLGAIADYLKPVRDPDSVTEWRGGWAGIVVDEAILNTPEYGDVRAFIRDRFYVKAVVSLGRQAFKYLAHTDAKTSVLFLVRKPEAGKAQREPVFYAHAERVGYGPTGEWVGDDLPQVKLQFDEMRSAVEAKYRGASVNPDSALRAVEALPGFGTAFYAQPVGGGTTRLDFFNARYTQRVRELREQFGTVPVLGDFIELAQVEHPVPNRRGEYPFAYPSRLTGTVEPKGLNAVAYATSDLWIVRDGDLVVSGIDAVNGSLGVAGPEVDGMVMSAEFYAYRVKDANTADAVFLSLVLRTQQARELLEGLTTGTSNRTRLENPLQLLELPIPPLPPIVEQRRIASTFQSSTEARREAARLAAEARGGAAASWDDPVGPDDRFKIEADPEDALRAMLRTRKA